MKRPLIIIAGPTAVGKTELSIELAKKINGQIISADSMQVYKNMDIGTAKISADQMQGIQHYMIDEIDPHDEFNVFEFQKMCKKYLNKIYEAGCIPIIVGGTGFYIQALLRDIDFTESETDDEYRAYLEELAKKEGNAFLHKMLEKVDEEAAIQIHENNTKRMIRALEYYKLTGEKISEHNAEQKDKQSDYNFAYFVLNCERQELYNRIDKRVDKMMTDGLKAEVSKLIEDNVTSDMTSMQGLGYKQMLEYYDGKCTLEEAVEHIKQETRHFAKRQLTWFRREKEVIWVDKDKYDDTAKLLEFCIKCLNEKNII